MSTPIVSAPNEEVAALHAQVRHYESELTERDAVIAEHQAGLAQRDAMIEHLQEQVRLLLARRFAPTSEKIPDGQLGTVQRSGSHRGRRARERAWHRGRCPSARNPEAHTDTPKRCHASTSSIGCPKMNAPARITAWSSSASAEVVSEQLDIIPMQVRVLRHIRGKYRCPCCEGHLRTAPMPAQPVPKSLASPGLLACIATAKYADALPLYRSVPAIAAHRPWSSRARRWRRGWCAWARSWCRSSTCCAMSSWNGPTC